MSSACSPAIKAKGVLSRKIRHTFYGEAVGAYLHVNTRRTAAVADSREYLRLQHKQGAAKQEGAKRRVYKLRPWRSRVRVPKIPVEHLVHCSGKACFGCFVNCCCCCWLRFNTAAVVEERMRMRERERQARWAKGNKARGRTSLCSVAAVQLCSPRATTFRSIVQSLCPFSLSLFRLPVVSQSVSLSLCVAGGIKARRRGSAPIHMTNEIKHVPRLHI